MYRVPEFKEDSRSAIVEFIERYPLAMLTGIGEHGSVVATHVPMLLHEKDGSIVLRGHMMRKTDHWHGFKAHPQALAAFTGPNGPIPASWGREVDNGGTWNYMAVHARGELRFLPQEGLIEILRTLKNRYEAHPDYRFEQLSDSYVQTMIPAIEGFEIPVDTLQAVFKLSQNRDHEDFSNILAELDGKGGMPALLAGEMRTLRARQ